MTTSFVDDLLAQASALATIDRRRPKQSNLRRAVSTAYYALFHEVVDASVTSVLGGSAASGTIGARLRRTVSHKSIKAAAQWFAGQRIPQVVAAMRGANTLPPPSALVQVCNAIVQLQEERHRADYDLMSPFARDEVQRSLTNAENAVHAFRGLRPSNDKTIFLLGCLFGRTANQKQLIAMSCWPGATPASTESHGRN